MGYFRSRAVDTFTPCPFSRNVKTPVPVRSLGLDPLGVHTMATSQPGFQLGILPERKIDRRALATGYTFLVLVVLFLVNLGLLFPDRIELKHYHVTEMIPIPSLKPEPEPIKPQPVVKKLLPAAPVFERPRLVVPHEVHRAPAPEPVEAPKVVVNQFTAPQIKMTSGGARPQLLHTGDFAGSSVAPTVNAAVQKVFRPEASAILTACRVRANRQQNFTPRRLVALICRLARCQSNGSGGAKGIKGTVASADFGNGIATGGNGDGRSNGRGSAVATGGFGSEQVVHNTPKVAQLDSGPPTNLRWEITYKPQPVYTDEARKLHLEGEVLLEVMFGANGTLHVNRVVRGLGHGLDEAAIAAANKMRFKPALRNGQAMDSTAIVHVVFQIAY